MLHGLNTLSMACMVEPILWFLALYSYTRFRSRTGFLSLRIYLATQLAVSAFSVPVLFLMLFSRGGASGRFLEIYTQIFWWGAVMAGIFAIVVIRDILKQLLTSLAGLQRVALVTFQWLLVVAFFVILDRMLADMAHATVSGELAVVVHGISVAQVVLLLLLAPFTFIVGRSRRSRYQDIMMGLGILAFTEGFLGIVFHAGTAVSPGAAVVTEHIVLVTTLVFWVCCFAVQEKTELPETFRIDSRLVRWSEKLRILERPSAPAERGH